MAMHADGGFRPRQGWPIAVCFGSLVFVLAGCQSGGQRDPVPASAVHDPVLQDIPKPAGFKIVDRSSMAKASGQYRIAQCEYVGGRDRESVRQFYREYMPEAGFTEKHWSLDKGVYSLTFESAKEVCDVIIGPSGLQTSVVVKIGPRAEGSSERPVAAQAAGDRKPPRRRSGGEP
jgi:hypothetical protein